jgi:hypothetical protein
MFFACFPKILKFQSAVFPNNLKVYTLKIHPGGPTFPVGPYAVPTGKKNPRKPSRRSINGTYGKTGAAGGTGRTRIELFFVCLYSIDPSALV